MVGSTTGPQPVEWNERDAMLYAIGVGAGLGDPTRELAYTTENSSKLALKTLPGFLTVLAVGNPPAMQELDIAHFLHAGQRTELNHPIPASGRGTVEARVVEVLDKGSGAIVTYETELRCAGDAAEPTGRMRTSIFVRGGGGFGGSRGSAPASNWPQRQPDAQVHYLTRPEQALLYRLSGDRHRLHSDPAFAREQGFERPILHGLCTFGFACRALIEASAHGDASRLAMMDARFARPVRPGATLTTQIWNEAPGSIRFRTLNDDGEIVLDSGSASVRP